MQQLCCLHFDWTKSGFMLLHQVVQVLVISIDTAVDEPYLLAISYIEIPVHFIVIIPLGWTGTFTSSTSCVYKLPTDEILITQSPQLLTLQVFHLSAGDKTHCY